ncbi:hypothetical protein Bcav_2527 [Beutenbergia cavernae DSM 12333]|uniref:Terminase n=1 Tax=Beutenbergia cavernae (strain ATCC BAA-8 / DSM 12333 / CCUG 43141 / JCM 11478 / NBRC 16432 / NCIMB 13614 / HKI 0122) TaxID=471853 RepID=C5BWV9_BEUC1|nr:hypothetical protein [Beutenbergia cavernae]ACQ80775.1 hypothetical protein Bcav_2527 [Beutenbergia cavernae DSM 12333]
MDIAPPPPPPKAPSGLGTAGRKLWRAIVVDLDLGPHEELLLTQACRTADILDKLNLEARDADLTVVNSRGDRVANPLLTEQRLQNIVLARLLASLRLPEGVDEDDRMSRPQRRGAARGAYNARRMP